MKEMKPDYVVRMEAELSELDNRIGKLTAFVSGNEIFAALTVEKQRLMCQQLRHMLAYAAVLAKRIELDYD